MAEHSAGGAVSEDALAFDISPEVVFRLGDELITDELQALVELVKNSYDASATRVVVTVDTQSEVVLPAPAGGDGSRKPGTHSDDDGEKTQDGGPEATLTRGWLEVKDDGDGMTRDQLQHGFLLISGSEKRAMKREGGVNRLGRTPLGDKGLGRLGVLRLGLHVEIRTRPLDIAEEHILSFGRWDFESHEALSDVRPHYEHRALTQTSPGRWEAAAPYDSDVACTPLTGLGGTVVRISALGNPNVWTDRVAVERELLTLVTPFQDIERFSLAVHIDDPDGLDPLPLGDKVELRRDLASVRWAFDWDGAQLRLVGRIKLRAFRPSHSNEQLTALWEDSVAPDRGAEYRRRLTAGSLESYGVAPGSSPWWMEVATTIRGEDVPATGGRSIEVNEPATANLGPFSGEIDSYYLGHDADLSGAADVELFESLDAYRRWVAAFRGIRVFRDGFGVRVNDDFLQLGTTFTGGRSFYALRPGNVVGYVALTARDTGQLEETTDREGFVVNPAYRRFRDLLETAVKRINLIQTDIGRELSAWAREAQVPVALPPSDRADGLARTVQDRKQRADDALAAAAVAQRTLTEISSGAALVTPEQARGAEQAREVLETMRTLVAEGQTLRDDLSQLAADSRQVEAERAQLRDQLRAAYQTVGLGIVAETVAHELTTITGRLLASANALSRQFSGPEHRAGRALASEVKGSVRAIRLQLRHLDPQLRYQRTRRRVLDVRVIANEVAKYHQERFENRIAVHVHGTGFEVSANQGRLQQALDNLFLNSEFWLGHGKPDEPRIDLQIERPLLVFRDNGPGVDPGLETSVFEPFVSGRTGEQGRGLGLFITRQVLKDDNATIALGARDPDGRRRSFVIDLSDALPKAGDA